MGLEKRLKILMLEDSAADAELVGRCLKVNNFNFISNLVFTRHDFIKSVEKFSPDIILSDHQLPQFDSFDALKILKENNKRIPFILVTGTVSEEFAAIIIKEGADDYILKKNLSRLPSAIKSALEKRQTEIEKENYQRQLEDKIQELNNFIYRISHDLKAPVASTLGLVAVARKYIKDKKAHEYFSLIEQSNKKMNNILMNFAQIVRMSQETIIKEKINLKKFINEIIEILKNLPEAEGIKFKIQVKPDLKISAGRDILYSILQNLIHNAIKYRKGIAESFIKIKIQKKAGKILFEISDNGIGIPLKLQPKIFEMFYRATISSSGSGLGLYIVKNATEKSGGKISFSSSPGKGTTFNFTLPE